MLFFYVFFEKLNQRERYLVDLLGSGAMLKRSLVMLERSLVMLERSLVMLERSLVMLERSLDEERYPVPSVSRSFDAS